MKIHCFYNDLVLSLKYLFDNRILPGIIKHYQFNIGNRSVQVDYNTKFGLPSAIINYQNSRPMFYRPHTITRSAIGINANMYPVLYDFNKDLTLMLHEELFEFSVELNINCESQLSALQIEHMIQNQLVLNKYLQLYTFYSFLEVDTQFINPYMFDIVNDDIANLFLKYNHSTDTTDYCFSVQYQPFVKLESISTQIGSTEQRSFQIACSLTIMNPIPVRVEIPPSERGESLTTRRLYEDNIILSTDILPILKVVFAPDENSEDQVGVAVINKQPKSNDFIANFNFNHIDGYDTTSYSGSIEGVLTGCEIKGKFTTDDVANKNITVSATVEEDYSKNTRRVLLRGAITGLLLNVKDDRKTGRITGNFFGEFDGKQLKQEITGDFVQMSKRIISDRKLKTVRMNKSSFNRRFYDVIVGNLFDQITGFNSRLFKIFPEGISINRAVLLYTETYTGTAVSKDSKEVWDVHHITNTCICDARGNFIFTFRFKSSKDVFIAGNIAGKIDPDTGKLIYDIHSDYNIELVALILDTKFESHPGYGARYIESISIDLLDTNQPIASNPATSNYITNTFKPHQLKKRLIRRYIISDNMVHDMFKEYSDYYLITLVLDIQFNYENEFKDNLLYWSFLVQGDHVPRGNLILDSNTLEIQLVKRDDSSVPNILEFKCEKPLFKKVFSKLYEDNPIFFHIYSLKRG